MCCGSSPAGVRRLLMLHIIKLAVGIEDIEHLASVQQRRLADMRATEGKGAKLWHRTRHAPRRASELLDGGSMYWVIKGRIAARQRLIGLRQITTKKGVRYASSCLIRKLCRRRRAVTAHFRGGDTLRMPIHRRISRSGRVRKISRLKWQQNCGNWVCCSEFFRFLAN